MNPLVPIAVFGTQAALMMVDELHFHRRRGLPRWERIGHPLDTATVLVCYGTALTLSPGQTYLATPPRKPSASFRPPSQSASTVRAQGLVWAGKRFRTKAQFSAWLASKGSSWAGFARQHPALAQALAARRA